MNTKSFVVRNSFNIFQAGELVLADTPPLNNSICVFRDGKALCTVQMSFGNLLPRSRFLLNKPKYNYCVLRRYFNDMEYVQDPKNIESVVFGPKPFHFESVGEVVYFLKLAKLKASDFLIGSFHYQPNLTPKNAST